MVFTQKKSVVSRCNQTIQAEKKFLKCLDSGLTPPDPQTMFKPKLIFTEFAPRPIQSKSHDVHGCVGCCPLCWQLEPRELETSIQRSHC